MSFKSDLIKQSKDYKEFQKAKKEAKKEKKTRKEFEKTRSALKDMDLALTGGGARDIKYKALRNFEDREESIDFNKPKIAANKNLNAALAAGDIFAFNSILKNFRKKQGVLPQQAPDDQSLIREQRRKSRPSQRQLNMLSVF